MRTAVPMLIVLLALVCVTDVSAQSAGIFVGPALNAANGDLGQGGGSGLDGGLMVEAPVSVEKRIRFDLSRTSWHAEDVDYRGVVTVADDVTLTTVRLSLVRAGRLGKWGGIYAGLGAGGYRYDMARTRLSHHWKAGVLAFLGIEFPSCARRCAIDTEVRLHVAGGPEAGPLWQVTLSKADAAVGMKVRF